MRYRLDWGTDPRGVSFKITGSSLLGRTRAAVPPAEWKDGMHPGVAFLKLLEDNDAAAVDTDTLLVEHETVASMSASDSRLLELPLRCPYSLVLEAKGAVSDPEFKVAASWIDKAGTRQIGLSRTGCILRSVVEQFLIVEPLHTLLVEVDTLNAMPGAAQGALDARMVQFDRMRAALSHATGDARADSYLERLTIHHATGIAIENRDGVANTFEPVLYGDRHDPMASPDHEETEADRQPLLPSEHAAKFRSILFPRLGARSHYRLKDGVYAVVDAPVEAAMSVVQRVNASDAATRAAFKADPLSFLIEDIEAAGGTGDVICGGSVLLQAMDYGERVLGVRVWDGAGVSFKIPVFHNWFPKDGEDVETYTIQIPGTDLPLHVRPAEVSRLRTAIESAKEQNKGTVTFNGVDYPLTPDLEQTVDALVGRVEPVIPKPGAKSEIDKPSKPETMVLGVAENEEDLLFAARLRDPRGVLSRTEPSEGMRTKAMPHQVDGVSWLRHAFLSGAPGVLLADDMGLGKTFQVLAFLNWLRSNQVGERHPVLIVAPKKLLDNWLDEVAEHVGPDGFGRPVLAYDEHLKRLKVSVSGAEGQLGRFGLDVDALGAADWVLTTYETLRDYHFSFARVRFGVAVYDEAQKMKSMASLINNAAKAQQPDFTVLMTGTPIENSVMDLWTLLDVAWPGFLGVSGKEFAKDYGQPTTEQVAELKARLIEPARVGGRECPPIMLRRFKSGVLTGLPPKEERTWRVEMPSEQAKAYDAVIAEQRTRQLPALQALQALRSVAFHPDLRMPGKPADHAAVIAGSARFRALFDILDTAARKKERVLVFIDLREGQRVLAELIRHRYRMGKHPRIIYGYTATKALKQIKADFQQGTGFDVLLLGPRSAGFGLTLTAANQVVHMNRWWNPAVEDQCSDRVYRLGQDKPVTIHLPIAVHPVLGDSSFDVVLEAMLVRKRGLSQDIVVSTSMTEEDLRDMFGHLMGGITAAPRGTDLMGWKEFEYWVGATFARVGYQSNVTPRSHDGGADLILRPPLGRPGHPVICQCKHKALGQGSIGEDAIDEVVRARQSYAEAFGQRERPVLMAVTNGRFTLGATSAAAEQGVVLVDRSGIDGLASLASNLLSKVSG